MFKNSVSKSFSQKSFLFPYTFQQEKKRRRRRTGGDNLAQDISSPFADHASLLFFWPFHSSGLFPSQNRPAHLPSFPHTKETHQLAQLATTESTISSSVFVPYGNASVAQHVAVQ
jgi:hypothetical protein